MALSQIELLTKQFYDWEKWGRGWYLFEKAVDLEPPFEPFFYHKEQTEYVDDGKHHTVFSFLGEILREKKKKVKEENDEFIRKPFIFEDDTLLESLSIIIPREHVVKVEEMEHLLLMLSMSELPCAFEILASSEKISIQITCRFVDTTYVKSQVKAFFPLATIQEKFEQFYDFFHEDGMLYGLEFGLKEEFMRPISSVKNFNIDPYTGLFGILDTLNGDEQVFMQILFKGTVNEWSGQILRSVTDPQGGDFFLDAPEMVPLAKEKVASPLFACSIRIVSVGNSISTAQQVAEKVSNALMRISDSPGNKLMPLPSAEYGADTFFEDFVLRRTRRLGMLLNARELVTLAHFPSASIVSSKLERRTNKTKCVPAITQSHSLEIGTNVHEGKSKVVSLSNAQRLRHMHVIGATGTGKSTFLLNLIAKDIKLNNGIAVLDPHGDLIENIVERIPEKRIKDVIVIDPADGEYPVGFNILQAHSDIEKEVLASDLVGVFRRLSTSWGDQMNSVLANAILAFLESSEGGALLDLRRFLIEKPFRDSFLKTVQDTNIKYYWQKEYPLLKTNSIGPILTRLDTFLRPKLIRNMVAQKKSIDFEDVINSGKILLVKLSQGLIGTENSYLLGSFIVSKIHQAAMARQMLSKEARRDFFMYIDEFQHFITPSMSAILSGARKYHLGLILAHQDMHQLVKQDSELASSVISNAGTRVCFRLGDTDAKRFEDGFSYFDSKDLQSLETGNAICRVERPEYDFNLHVEKLPDAKLSDENSITQTVIAQSREKYGGKKEEIEALLNKSQPFEISDGSQVLKPTVISNQLREYNDEATIIQTKPIVKTIPLTEQQTAATKAKLLQKSEQSEHKYLQVLIKKMAESRGFKANVEELTPDASGRVDVSLERNGFRIGCEIAMTTTDTWEVHNITKCLAAGFDVVVTCSTNKTLLEKIQSKVNSSFTTTDFAKIMVLEPDELFKYLDAHIAKEASTEKRMKGYRVKVEYNPGSTEKLKSKKDSITKVMLESLKEKNKK